MGKGQKEEKRRNKKGKKGEGYIKGGTVKNILL